MTERLEHPRKRERSWNRVQIIQQETQVWELRLQGLTQKEICQKTGLGPSVVERRWRNYAADHPPDNVNELRAIVTGQLGWMYSKLVPRIEDGDVPAVEAALKVLKSLREMNGVDMPAQLDLNVHHTVTPDDIPLRKMLTSIRGRNKALAEHGDIPPYISSEVAPENSVRPTTIATTVVAVVEQPGDAVSRRNTDTADTSENLSHVDITSATGGIDDDVTQSSNQGEAEGNPPSVYTEDISGQASGSGIQDGADTGGGDHGEPVTHATVLPSAPPAPPPV